jgi:ABC-2 type transport system permease protein
MLSDIRCVVWKEWREQLSNRGLRGLGGVALNLVVFGIVLPLQLGGTWVKSPALILVWAWVPMFLVSAVISDAFAGERERHTLETLLATRLPDRAIVLGKIAAAISYAGAVTLGCIILSTVTFAARHELPEFSATLMVALLAVIVAGLGVSILVAALGTMISLRSSTVRHATQALTGAVMVLMLGPVVLLRMAPSSAKAVLLAYPGLLPLVPLAFVLLLAAADTGLVALVLSRFRRSRLMSA